MTGEGNISVYDIRTIQKVILFIETTFPIGESAVFIPADHTFADPTMPFPYPTSINLTALAADQTNQNFIGIKLGDTNQSSNYYY